MMSHNSIDGRLKGLEERIGNEMRNQREGGFHGQLGLGSARRRPRPRKYCTNIPKTHTIKSIEHKNKFNLKEY